MGPLFSTAISIHMPSEQMFFYSYRWMATLHMVGNSLGDCIELFKSFMTSKMEIV